MKTIRKIIILILAAISVIEAYPQSGDETRTGIFNSRFRTLKVSQEGDFMGIPVIRKGTEDRISINFDELSEDNSYLQYKILHFTSDWRESQLVESEYLDGFNFADIEDYGFSSGTYEHYVNYNITIPNEKINPKVSGNYLVQVYDPNQPDDVILQARFAVSENVFPIQATATSKTDKGFNTRFQQINVSLNLGNFQLRNPYSDLLLVVNQNGMPDMERVIRNPQRVSGPMVIYEHINDLIFPAGNEFRRFETVRTNYPGMGIDRTGFNGKRYEAYLYTDHSRENRAYSYDQTQRGRYMIDEYNASDPSLGSDYIMTYFTLDHPKITDGEVYVDGEFTHHRYDFQNRMIYNDDIGKYELSLPLKQGSYNYQYVVVPKGGKRGDATVIEGNKHETRNEYQIFVYLRQPGDRYDRLLSTKQIFLNN